ncbi:MAG: bifunctional folylpolyglutamate synthase/dihydrofolate synthase [Thermoplasmata archaeon]|nr:bifunctional folylpolyglutamate synthase/dihydrofolate synthase [Thermoplasmata archaeon]
MAASSYRKTLDELYGLRRFGTRPGLEVIRALLGGLGNPERSFRAIHITGSKGKGSVAAMSAAIVGATGASVGLFTSPHLQSYRERIQVQRRRIPASEVVRGVARVQAAAAELLRSGGIERPATFFEITTALAFDYFARKKVEHAVIEVGLGGRLDSTNVIDAPVGVITSIELEHTELLGPTVEHIAREKAGILHRGMRAVVGVTPPNARAVIERHAKVEGVPLWHLGEEIRTGPRTIEPDRQRFDVAHPGRTIADVAVPLHGPQQAANAALAIAAADVYGEAVGFRVSDDELRAALSKVRWRGRSERLPGRPELFVDVAHTPESVRALGQTLVELRPLASAEETAIVFGCLADKLVDPIFDALGLLARTIVVVPVRSSRSAATADLRRHAVGRFPRIVVADSLKSGLTLARAATGPDGYTLVTGSDYLIGELLDELEGRSADEPDLSDPGVPAPEAPRRAPGTAAR